MYAGIDIGSSSSKVALIDETGTLAASAVVNMGTGTGGVEEAMNAALSKAGIGKKDIRYTVATGYGRINYEGADKQLTEITCHAKGVSFLAPEAKTIIDIGGQDAKVIKLDKNGRVVNFAMNEKCAAGTGRFLEVMARVLGCGIDQLSDLAERSEKEVAISSVCTVFAESEVISRLAAGEAVSDVAKGAHRAIAKRVAGLAGRIGYEPKIVMTGGVALNRAMIQAMAWELQTEVEASRYPQTAGAIGAALFAWEQGHVVA